MNQNGKQTPQTPPVSQGDELTVTIEAVGEKGDGICKKKGFILFVPNTKEGEICKIRITKVFSKVGFGEVVARLDESALPAKAQRKLAPINVPTSSRVTKEPVESTDDFGSDLSLESDDDSFADEFDDSDFSEAAPTSDISFDETVPFNKVSDVSVTVPDVNADDSVLEADTHSDVPEVPTSEKDTKKDLMVEEEDDLVPTP